MTLWEQVHRYGWACPPPWNAVHRAVSGFVHDLPTPTLVLGTGGWSFAVDALDSENVRALDDLDPWALARVPKPASVLAISSSGTTAETRELAETFPPTRWLTGRELSPRGRDDQVALFGAPLSTAFLLPAAIAHPAELSTAYEELRDAHEQLGVDAAALATRLGDDDLTIAPPVWANDGLKLWLLQLGRQVLGGKASYAPAVTLVDGPAALDLRDTRPGLAGLMTALFRAAALVACLAVRHDLAVTEHPNVIAYKRLLGRRGPAYRMVDLPGWLSDRPELTRLHVVRYGGDPAPLPDAGELEQATGRRVEVYRGSAWNHHSFQSVYREHHTAVLVLAGTRDGLLRDIAEATRLALGDRALLVEATS
jgi:hypothetical protein